MPDRREYISVRRLLKAAPGAYSSKKARNRSVAPGDSCCEYPLHWSQWTRCVVPRSVRDSTAETRDANEADTERSHWRDAMSIQNAARSNLPRLTGDNRV